MLWIVALLQLELVYALFEPAHDANFFVALILVVVVEIVLRPPVDHRTLVRGRRRDGLVELVEFPLSQRLFELSAQGCRLLLLLWEHAVVPAFVQGNERLVGVCRLGSVLVDVRITTL